MLKYVDVLYNSAISLNGLVHPENRLKSSKNLFCAFSTKRSQFAQIRPEWLRHEKRGRRKWKELQHNWAQIGAQSIPVVSNPKFAMGGGASSEKHPPGYWQKGAGKIKKIAAQLRTIGTQLILLFRIQNSQWGGGELSSENNPPWKLKKWAGTVENNISTIEHNLQYERQSLVHR